MVDFNRDYDVRGLAGYSIDGNKYYLDKDTPKFFEHKGKKIPTDKFLLVHETVEKALEDLLNYDYKKAHNIATAAEKQAVEKQGISWEAYDTFMNQQIKQNEKDDSAGQKDFPPDLEDPEHPGKAVVSKILKAKFQVRKILADMKKIKVFLDDETEASKRQEWAQGYDIWVTTPEEAIDLLKKGNVSHISLDHDLSLEPEDRNGYMVAKFIEEAAYNSEIPKLEWKVHSMNPRGKQNIIAALQSADRFWKERNT